MSTVKELLERVIDAGIKWAVERKFGEEKVLRDVFARFADTEKFAAAVNKFLLPPYQDGALGRFLLSEFEKGLLFISRIGDLGLPDDVRDQLIKAIQGLSRKDISALNKIAGKACEIMIAYNKTKKL